MLTIRLKRTGRHGHAQFRIVVQDSRFSPSSGRIVEYLGSYNPHSKETQLDKDKLKKYLGDGAQPSDRVAKLAKKEGIKLPSWVKIEQPKKRDIKHPEKLRKNRPADQTEPQQPSETADNSETPQEAEQEQQASEPEQPAEADDSKAETSAEQQEEASAQDKA